MHRLTKLVRSNVQPARVIFSQRTYAKEIKFGAAAREEMIAGWLVACFVSMIYCNSYVYCNTFNAWKCF